MPQTIAKSLDGLHLKTAKASLREPEPDLNRLKDAGALIQLALKRAGIQEKTAASLMGISGPQFSAQLAGKEHLSWQRLQRLSDAFFLELLIVLAEHRGIARVRTQIEMERKVAI